VVDFLSVGWLPVFNIADAAVLGGAGCLIVLALFAPEAGVAQAGTTRR
jgi:lipoprotein signal peptidase